MPKILLENTIIYLIRSKRFYAELIQRMDKSFSNQISTLGVSLDITGPKLVINPNFFNAIESIEERAECLEHEAEHLLRGHLSGRELSLESDQSNSNKILFNIAEDIAINDYLLKLPKDFKSFKPDGSIEIDPETNEPTKGNVWNTQALRDLLNDQTIKSSQAFEYYYHILKENKDKILQNSGHSVLDDHSQFSNGNISPEVAKQIVKDIVNSVYNSLNSQDKGNIPGHLKILIDKMNKSNKDWRKDIAMFGSQCSSVDYEETTRRRNRRYGLKCPGKRPKNKTHLVIGIDNSGSVNDQAYLQFHAEINKLHQLGINLTVIECDSKINGLYKFDPKRKVEMLGRGGTLFGPIFDKVNSKEFISEYGAIDGLIMFSDMDDYGELVKKPKYKVLWACLPNCKPRYEWGSRTTVEVKSEK
jgi:predicted metal-dependent peptidase